MSNLKLAIIISLMFAITSAVFAIKAMLAGQLSSVALGIGITFIFIWYALNAELLISRLPLRKLVSIYSIEQSKYKYFAYIAILSVPVAFTIRLLERL